MVASLVIVGFPPHAAAFDRAEALDFLLAQPVLGQVRSASACNDRGIIQNPPGSAFLLGQPAFRDAMASLGQPHDPWRELAADQCDRIQMASRIVKLREQDGTISAELDILILPPWFLVEATVPAPHDQDVRDPERMLMNAQQPGQYVDPARWGPLIVNSNLPHVPCHLQDGAPDAPCGEIAVPCDCSVGVSVDALALASVPTPLGPVHATTPGVNVLYVDGVGRAEFIHRLDVHGFDLSGELVFAQAFNGVAVVQGRATERLERVDGAVFQVQAYLTAAAEATGEALTSIPAVIEPLDLPAVVLDLAARQPTPTSGGDAPSAAASAVQCDSSGAVCRLSTNNVVRAWKDIRYIWRSGWGNSYCDHEENQCARLDAMNRGWESHDLRFYSWFYRPEIDPDMDSGDVKVRDIMRSGGAIRRTMSADTYASTPPLTITGASKILVTPIWTLSGEIRLACDGSGGCAAAGARAQIGAVVTREASAGGPAENVVDDVLFESAAASVQYGCPPDLPVRWSWWSLVEGYACLWGWGETGDEVQQGFHEDVFARSYTIDIEPGRAYSFHTYLSESLCCVTPRNIPQIPELTGTFHGFYIERIN